MNAIVTGASRGIGKAIALKLAEEGYNLCLNYRSSDAEIKEVMNIAKEFGVKVILVKADISNFDSAKELIDKAYDEFGSISLLVNNAGITKDQLLPKLKEEDFDSVINVNLKGVFNCTKHIIKPMMKQRQGSIINITSVIGQIGNAGQSNYAASKAGVIGFTKSIAKEVGSRGIRVNAVAPGFIETDMTKELPEAVIESMLTNIPLKKSGKPEDVANAVSFLANENSHYITGQVLVVDGGMTM